MVTQTADPPTNTVGEHWSQVPDLKRAERRVWNALYAAFVEELDEWQEFPASAPLTDEQMETLAYNLAYRAVWDVLRSEKRDVIES